MSDRNQRRTESDTTLLNYFVKTIGIQIGVVFAVIALLFIVFLSYQNVFSRQEQQDQDVPASSEGAAPNDENTTPVDVNVPNTLNSVRSQYSYEDIYLSDAHPDVWYDDYTLWSNAKKRAIAKYGGSEETERAVELALRWLNSRQSPDGSWTINNNVKSSLNVNGATGLALLPFLTADGLKWTDGLECSSEHKDAVEKGLNYLIQHGKTGKDFKGVRFHEPGESFYNHALAALALGEAYVMTRNNAYLEPAQGGLEYILYSQNPDSSIWDDAAYPSDNIINTYWNVETLRGYSKLHVYKKSSYDRLGKTTQNVRRFLDSVQTATDDARTVPDSITPKAAQELLLRMYLYRFDSIPDLDRSAEQLCKSGPTNDSYYNYIATQIAFHYGGALWKEWNAAMREKLINSQIQTGTEAGAWDFSKEQSRQNVIFPSSPLIDTALSALTLEVYYRNKPLYHEQEYRKGFPIE